MQLRRTLNRAAVGLGLVTFIACAALVVSTSLLRRMVEDVDRSQQLSRLTSRLAHQSFRYEIEPSALGRSMAEAQGRVLLARATELARTREERRGFADLSPLLEQHWRTAEANGDVRLPPALVSALVRVDEQFAASADAESSRARTIDMLSNVVAVAIAMLLASGVLAFLWMLQQRVFRPIQAVAASVDRFAGGDLQARAPVRGADEIRRIASAQNEMADALARTRADQLRYVATVVHDLRNPLAAVQLAAGYVTPARPLPPEPRIREIFALIDRQLRRLNSLVGDVLNAVQIEGGDIVLRKTICDLGDIAEASVSLFQSMSPYHHFELQREGLTRLRGDATRLEQVINNLVGNAVKYSPAGSLVKVSVSCEDERLFLWVADEGPGISPELAREIFHPFTRGPSEHEEVAGIGLGLYVSKRIVEAHGGVLEAFPTDGQGATFLMTLPRDLPAMESEARPLPRPPAGGEQPPA
jgi:signal transduction histidine kinase